MIGIARAMPQNDLAELDVGRLDRVGPRRERDVLEAVRRAEVIDLRAEDSPVCGGAGGLVEHEVLLAAISGF